VATLRVCTVLAAATLLACAFPVSVGWFRLRRLVSGMGGGLRRTGRDDGTARRARWMIMTLRSATFPSLAGLDGVWGAAH
jgi:hypothetical protein